MGQNLEFRYSRFEQSVVSGARSETRSRSELSRKSRSNYYCFVECEATKLKYLGGNEEENRGNRRRC